MEIVNDREPSDLVKAKMMIKEKWIDLTVEEQEEWLNGYKGSITIFDLIRISQNTIILQDMIKSIFHEAINFDYGIPKTDWVDAHKPKKEELYAISDACRLITNAIPNYETTDIDVFRFCTIDKLNHFETAMKQSYLVLKDLQEQGEHINSILWDVNENIYQATFRPGGFPVNIYLPVGATIIATILSGGTGTYTHVVTSEKDRMRILPNIGYGSGQLWKLEVSGISDINEVDVKTVAS